MYSTLTIFVSQEIKKKGIPYDLSFFLFSFLALLSSEDITLSSIQTCTIIIFLDHDKS